MSSSSVVIVTNADTYSTIVWNYDILGFPQTCDSKGKYLFAYWRIQNLLLQKPIFFCSICGATHLKPKIYSESLKTVE